MLALAVSGEPTPAQEVANETRNDQDVAAMALWVAARPRTTYPNPDDQHAAQWAIGRTMGQQPIRAGVAGGDVHVQRSGDGDRVQHPPAQSQGAVVDAFGAEAEWLAGYRAFGGPAGYEQRFTRRVIVCEASWSIEPGNPSYIGPMQWHPDSWARVSAYTGLFDRYSWYAHGAATAAWVTHFGVDPAGTGGWFHTWNYGC